MNGFKYVQVLACVYTQEHTHTRTHEKQIMIFQAESTPAVPGGLVLTPIVALADNPEVWGRA